MTEKNTARSRSQGSPAIACKVFSGESVYDGSIDIAALRSSDRFKVCFVVGGAGIHRLLDQEIPCSKGDICIIPPNVPHGYYLSHASDVLTVRQMELDIEDWFSGAVIAKDSPEYCHGVFRESSVVAYATLNAYMQDRVYLLYDYIECELQEQKQGWRDLIRAHLTDLFISIARYISAAIKNTVSVSAKEWSVAATAMRVANEQCGDSTLSLATIAAELYISRSQLSRIFKSTTGVGFPDYLRSIRVRHVCALLKTESATIEAIARACGFRDMNTFYKVFESIVGMTPKQYKQLQINTPQKNKTQKKENAIMVILSDISEQLQKGKAKIVKELVQQAIDEGADPEQILNEGLLAGMSVIGEKFKNNEVFVPEVLVAARAMNMGAQILKPHLAAQGVQATGKICIGTVQGDLHDIGKNLVKMMMEGKGLEVIDLGTDVPAETFVQTAIEQNCQVICCSALLTTTMPVMEAVVKAAEAAGIRSKVKIMIGGAPVSQEYNDKIGADCYTVDAASAADAAVEFCKV